MTGDVVNSFINDVVEGIDPYEFNRGGCLFLAYAFFKWLQFNQKDTSSFFIVQYDWEGEYYIQRNLSFINGESSSADSSHHYSWLYQDIEMDAHGPDKREIMEDYMVRRVWVELDTDQKIEKFCQSALLHAVWNSEFNRQYARARIFENVRLELFV